VGQTKKFGKWVVLGTGGTIAGTAASPTDHTGYTAAQLGVQHLLDAVPGLSTLLHGDTLLGEQVAQLDSKDMDHATWQALAQRCQHWLAQPDVGGIVITHGTDTLEETACFLQQVLDSAKPVVITCAMRPATSVEADGPQNLLDALTVVRDPQAQGVLAVCAGHIHRAHDVQKVHPYQLDAFSSGDAGPCGQVVQGQVQWSGSCPASEPHPHAAQALVQAASDWPWVEVLDSHAGADARLVTALVTAGAKGLVVAGTGNGTVHQTLLTALATAQSQGVAVRLTTRCAPGQIVGQPAALQTAPLGLNAYKARISLMLDLMH
jgi:L-asparaginase